MLHKFISNFFFLPYISIASKIFRPSCKSHNLKILQNDLAIPCIVGCSDNFNFFTAPLKKLQNHGCISIKCFFLHYILITILRAGFEILKISIKKSKNLEKLKNLDIQSKMSNEILIDRSFFLMSSESTHFVFNVFNKNIYTNSLLKINVF